MQLTKRHKMFSKALFLRHQRLAISPAHFQLAYNNYDKELVELMLAAEKKCRKQRPNFLEWSPVVGMQVRHLHVYRWILRYKNSQTVNIGNLKRSCESQGLSIPVHMTLEDAELAERACLCRLEEL